jgi:hypothetical protein
MHFGNNSGMVGRETTYPDRKHCPAISVYFTRDDDNTPPHKLSCMFCKRTILDGVTGRIDKVIDAALPADEFDLAMNIQCKLCRQLWRILGAPKAES